MFFSNRSFRYLNGVLILLVLFSLFISGAAKIPQGVGRISITKPSLLNPTGTLLNINNWSFWVYYDGTMGVAPDGNAGGIYPRGKTMVIYQDGLVWGTIVDGQIRVGGQTYRTGTEPVLDRIYRIRKDWLTLSEEQLIQDAAEFFNKKRIDVTREDMEQIYESYKRDWYEWPWLAGAPWVDVDGNGVYDPDVDEAGFANADQVIWFKIDDADESRALNLYGSPPIGLTVEVTIWGYRQPEAPLGQVFFKQYKIINTSGQRLDSMYIAQWSDPDIGDYTDDLVGCDSLLSLAFAYNGKEIDKEFAQFNLAPGAAGYDFVQGPLIPSVGDTARIGTKFKLNYKNLPMTAFGYFPTGNEEYDDPDLGVYRGTLQWYNLLRGYIPIPDVENPIPFTHRKTGKPTKFPVNGDPVTGEGDVDGVGSYNFTYGARRMAMSSGPFSIEPGGTQYVTIAVIGGIGRSRLQSVQVLKHNDKIAQFVSDRLFRSIAKAPPKPSLTATPLEREIVLNWGRDKEAVQKTEETKYYDSDSTFYRFEGYNIYQLPSPTATKDEAVRIATFDVVDGVTIIEGKKFLPQYGQETVVPLQRGRDTGIQRYFVVQKNYLTGEPLYPGNQYYFAVTAYNYNPNPQVVENKTFESDWEVVHITTQSEKPGKKYTAKPLTDVPVFRVSGGSDGQVSVTVIDPAAVTGHQYEIFFEVDQDTGSATFGEVLWGLKDVTTGEIKASRQEQATSLATARDAPIVDGLQIRVAVPNTPDDVFSFTAPEVKEGADLALEAVKKVTVYPNPYYASNPQEPSRFYRFVTFYHLPKKATIRIFDLGGNLVRKLEKNSDDQFFRWDLENENGLLVASGIYIAHIEMTLPDGRKVTKVLKIFIIQRIQVPAYF